MLAGLLLDLSLLDQYMFKFRPGTLAAAALFMARVTAAYYSKVCLRSFFSFRLLLLLYPLAVFSNETRTIDLGVSSAADHGMV